MKPGHKKPRVVAPPVRSPVRKKRHRSPSSLRRGSTLSSPPGTAAPPALASRSPRRKPGQSPKRRGEHLLHMARLQSAGGVQQPTPFSFSATSGDPQAPASPYSMVPRGAHAPLVLDPGAGSKRRLSFKGKKRAPSSGLPEALEALRCLFQALDTVVNVCRLKRQRPWWDVITRLTREYIGRDVTSQRLRQIMHVYPESFHVRWAMRRETDATCGYEMLLEQGSPSTLEAEIVLRQSTFRSLLEALAKAGAPDPLPEAQLPEPPAVKPVEDLRTALARTQPAPLHFSAREQQQLMSQETPEELRRFSDSQLLLQVRLREEAAARTQQEPEVVMRERRVRALPGLCEKLRKEARLQKRHRFPLATLSEKLRYNPQNPQRPLCTAAELVERLQLLQEAAPGYFELFENPHRAGGTYVSVSADTQAYRKALQDIQTFV